MSGLPSTATAGGMKVEWRSEGETLHVTWRGRLDQSSSQAVQSCLEPLLASSTQVTVDCTDLTMISSLGIRLIIVLHKHVKSRGGTLTLHSLQPSVRDVLEFAGINRLVGIGAATAVPVS